MILSDVQIERYSRQILLPEVGGRGQARLLDARVGVVGRNEAASLAALLVGRAGVGRLELFGAEPRATLPPECRLTRHPDVSSIPAADVVIDLADDASTTAFLARRMPSVHVVGSLRGARVAVATLVGRPCGVCLRLDEPSRDAQPRGLERSAAALALGALAAAEGLRVLWQAPVAGRLQLLDLTSGACAARALTTDGGCAVCGGRA